MAYVMSKVPLDPPPPHWIGLKVRLQQKSKVHKVCDFSCLIYNKNNDAVKIWMGQGTHYSAHLKMTHCWLEMTDVYFHPKVDSGPDVSHFSWWEAEVFAVDLARGCWLLLTLLQSTISLISNQAVRLTVEEGKITVSN